MATVGEQIQSADEAICRNIESLADQRGIALAERPRTAPEPSRGSGGPPPHGSPDAEFNYAAVEPGLAFVKGEGKFNFLGRFHKLIQISASHYTLDGDASERLMLKYYEYLLRIRSLLQRQLWNRVLANLEAFPVDLDPSLREYHEKIAARIEAVRSAPSAAARGIGTTSTRRARSSSAARIYYEVTFYRPSTR